MSDSDLASPGPTSSDTLVFDPYAEGFTDDPFPHYAELREIAPVHQHPLGFWMLAKYRDVSALLRSGCSVDESHAGPSPLREINEAAYGDTRRRFEGLSMLDVDPPDHTRLRRLVSKAFTPRAIDALEPRVAELVDEALDRIAAGERVDLVEELAFPLPFAVISEMLGMPPVDHERLRDLTMVAVRSTEPVVDPELLSEIAAADGELMRLTSEVITAKRATPGDDLLTALITAEHEGDVLSDKELAAQVLLLYIAGHETTVNLIAGGMDALLQYPEQLAMLRQRPELATNAVEELLRFVSPVQMSRRVTTQPYPIGDQDIPAGSFVLASLAAANRDQEFWGADAGELRIDRENARQNTSFGAGVHHCLGAALARLEARVALERLVQRFPNIARDGEVEWNGRINLRGPAKLPIAVS